jgi:hypothetical protein
MIRKYLVGTAGAIAMGTMLLLSAGSASADKDNHQGQNNQGERNDSNGTSSHSCVNPAGHTRGWCKNHSVNCNNGTYNCNNCNNGTYNCNNGNNTSISGVIVSVSGTQVRLLRGLGTITINDSRALNSGYTSNLYVGRTVTAYGYWSNNVFYANRIG